MAKKPTYYEMLLDVRWQKKRLERLNAADWKCQDCLSATKTLHVHHAYYEKGKAPWEYPDYSLTVLCVDCHRRAQDVLTRLHQVIGRLGPAGYEVLLGCAEGLLAQANHDFPVDVSTFETATGVGLIFHARVEQVMAAAIDGLIDGNMLDKLSPNRVHIDPGFVPPPAT